MLRSSLLNRTTYSRSIAQLHHSHYMSSAAVSSRSASIARAAVAAFVSVSDPGSHPQDYRAHHPATGSNRFHNPWPSFHGKGGPVEFLRAKLRGEVSSKAPPENLKELVGFQDPSFEYPENQQSKLKAAWLGHAAMFFEFPSASSSFSTSSRSFTPADPSPSRGLRVLTDPAFSNRCSPSQYFGGPYRMLPPPCPVSKLPEIDLILISHNHYDHLDSGTMSALAKRFPDIRVVVPIGGVKGLVASFGVPDSQITEMDWWDEIWFTKTLGQTEEKLRIGYLPSQHFTGRGLMDQGDTLWGSFSIESTSDPHSNSAGETSSSKRVFFAGDTGRRTISREVEQDLQSASPDTVTQARKLLDAFPTCPAHRQIAEHRGGFDLLAIPIGAYKPQWFMSRVHIDPEEAVAIYKELYRPGTTGVGIHWGTWQLTAEEVMAPKYGLEEQVKSTGVQGFETWNMGQMRFI